MAVRGERVTLLRCSHFLTFPPTDAQFAPSLRLSWLALYLYLWIDPSRISVSGWLMLLNAWRRRRDVTCVRCLFMWLMCIHVMVTDIWQWFFLFFFYFYTIFISMLKTIYSSWKSTGQLELERTKGSNERERKDLCGRSSRWWQIYTRYSETSAPSNFTISLSSSNRSRRSVE